MRNREDKGFLPATIPGPRPAAFPLGSLESRATARTMAKSRAEQDAKEPFLYRARFDENGYPLEPVVIYDYVTGLPVTEAKAGRFLQPQQQDETSVPVPLAAPGESIDETPAQPKANPRIITVEFG